MRMPLCGIAGTTKLISTAYLLILTEFCLFILDHVRILFYAAAGKYPLWV